MAGHSEPPILLLPLLHHLKELHMYLPHSTFQSCHLPSRPLYTSPDATPPAFPFHVLEMFRGVVVVTVATHTRSSRHSPRWCWHGNVAPFKVTRTPGTHYIISSFPSGPGPSVLSISIHLGDQSRRPRLMKTSHYRRRLFP